MSGRSRGKFSRWVVVLLHRSLHGFSSSFLFLFVLASPEITSSSIRECSIELFPSDVSRKKNCVANVLPRIIRTWSLSFIELLLQQSTGAAYEIASNTSVLQNWYFFLFRSFVYGRRTEHCQLQKASIYWADNIRACAQHLRR